MEFEDSKIKKVFQKAFTAHQEGNLGEAERLYRAVLLMDPAHSESNHNLGVLTFSRENSAEPLLLFKAALESNPQQEKFLVSYVKALLKVKNFEAAKQVLAEGKEGHLFSSAVQEVESELQGISSPEITKKYKGKETLTEIALNQAENERKNHRKRHDPKTGNPPQKEENFLLHCYQCGDYVNAEKLSLTMIEKYPKHPVGWKVLAAILVKLNRLEDGVRAIHQATRINPRDHESHNVLGVTLRKLGKLEEAEASFKKSITLKPRFAEALNNLGETLLVQTKYKEAFTILKKAIELNYDSNTYYNFGISLQYIEFKKPLNGLNEIIISLLEKDNCVYPSQISGAVISLVKLDPLISIHLSEYFSTESSKSLEKIIPVYSQSALLLKFMGCYPIADLQLEAVFTEVRSRFLLQITELSENSDLLRFLSALALQCFINEYIYPCTEKEIRALKKLELLVAKIFSDGGQPSGKMLLCLATYKPLCNYDWCNEIFETSDLKEVINRQVREPASELALQSKLPSLGKITDDISVKVREQYEENPYPRWFGLRLHRDPYSISKFAKDFELKLHDRIIVDIEAPNILIAGCGTGQHSISVAARFANSNVLAVDLSMSSLSYAERKTKELGIKNLSYIQADILSLDRLGKRFDIIESSGVLHHMNNPLDGWRVLAGLLNKGGLMKIGLYSKLARPHIVKAREEFAESYGVVSKETIKRFRKDLIGSDEEHHLLIHTSHDFYSLSSFRDLLIHSNEHRFTLLEIQEHLSELALKFCGFENQNTVTKFRQVNGGSADPYDLTSWAAYEEVNPRTFAGMYEFWCQKVG